MHTTVGKYQTTILSNMDTILLEIITKLENIGNYRILMTDALLLFGISTHFNTDMLGKIPMTADIQNTTEMLIIQVTHLRI